MDKKALSVKPPKKESNSFANTTLLVARIAAVYYFISLFFSALNPIAVTKGVVDYPLTQVFGDFSAYKDGINAAGYYVVTALDVIAYVMLAVLIVLGISFVLSFFAGKVKKIAVTAMAAAFCIGAVGCIVAGVFSFTAIDAAEAVQKPYAFLLAAIFAAAAVCCIISMKHKTGESMYGKNYDHDTMGGKLTDYFSGSASEVKKIIWPDRKTVIKNTLVVLAFIILMGVIIGLFDAGWAALFGLIFKSGS